MLDLVLDRRNFLKVGGIGGGLSVMPFSDNIFAQEEIANDKSVVWLWLAGGPSQFETFHAPPDIVPDPYRPVTGVVRHNNGLAFGGLFTELIQRGEHLTAVNSFSHGDSSHRQATHWVMTGHRNPKRENTANSEYPGHGAIASTVFGSNHPVTGMPAYVKQGNIEGEQPTFLGGAHKPFDPSNKDNLTPRIDITRFRDRKNLLRALDQIGKVPSPQAKSFTDIGNQAYDVILGNAKDAFNLDKEPNAVRRKYGKKGIGEQLLLARRLAQFGTKFITVNYGGWDMHSDIKKGLDKKVPPLDKAISAFIDDIYESGLSENVLLVVTGEFGRTKFNKKAGRDHWPSIVPLLLSGGRYNHGRVIGAADKAYSPIENKIEPIDVAATLFDHFEIPKGIQRIDPSGRPRYLLEGEGQLIL